MSKSNSKAFDVIIIGAGISGLVCGCYLAKAGKKILIVEQHDKPGGYCTSFKRKEFLFDAAAHSFGSYRMGGNFKKILAELGVDKLIGIRRFDPSDTVITPDFSISFFNDVQKTISHLATVFPEEKQNIERFYNFILSVDQLGTVSLRNKTFADLLGEFFKDIRLINTLAVPVFGNGGLPPSLLHAFTGLKIFSEFIIDGGYYPDDSMQSLPNALDTIVKQHQGTILYKSLVKKIIINDGKASGVVLDNNLSFCSECVVSACDITQTLKTFIGDKIIDGPSNDKLDNMMPSISTFTLYMGIARPFKGLPQEGTNTWYLPYYDLDKMYTFVGKSDFDNVGGFMLRVSPDKKTILAFSPAPYNTKSFWRQHKKEITQLFLKRIEKHIPGLQEHIAYLDSATPYTHYRYTLNLKGANYGWAAIKSQLFDPDFCHKSFVDGLYVTGHWTAQTHGIPGVAYLGYNTAKLILKREKNDVLH